VASGATLRGTGLVQTNVTVAHRGTVSAGRPSTNGNLNVKDLTFCSAVGQTALVSVVQGSATSIVVVTNNNGLVNNGKVRITVTGSGFPVGVYDLIRFKGSLSGTAYEIAAVPNGIAEYSLITNAGNAIQLSVISTGFPIWVGSVNNQWRPDPTLLNWKVSSNGNPLDYRDGDFSLFETSALLYSVNITTTVAPAAYR
jgi:fibronectin-binding autotransporter adhesin